MAKTLLQEIAAKVAKKQGITIKAAETFVTNFFSVVREGLEADKQVKVRGLGTFKIIPVKPRESVNVNTGERVLIEGHDKLTFTPDSSMKELVNRPFSQFDTVELEDGVDFGDMTTEENTTEEVVVADTPIKEEEPVKDEEPSKDEDTEVEEAVEKKELLETNIPIEEEAPIEDAIAEADNKAKDVETAQEEESVDVEEPVVGKTKSDSEEEKPTIEEEKTIVEEESVVEKESVAEEQTIAIPVTPLVSKSVVKGLEPREAETISETEETTPGTEETTPETKETISETKEPGLPAEGDKGGIPWAKVAVFAIILIVGIGVGLWLNNRNNTTTDQPQTAAVDTVATDSIEAQPALATNTDNDGIDYEKLNADPRVKYGAYTIEGVDTVVTLRPGQTMESYCRATLGSNMLCYFQALNDTTELSGGATMKVPKVKVKPKGK